MENKPLSADASDSRSHTLSLQQLMLTVRRLIVPMLTLFFVGFTLLYAGAAIIEFWSPILSDGDVGEGLIKGLHMGVVALAVFELAQILYEEYEAGEPQDMAHDSMVARIRRGLIRFVSVVCTALVLEALIMVIKYSQKDLAGFLYYPVAIIAAAALLLMSLGVFTRLTRDPAADARPVASPA